MGFLFLIPYPAPPAAPPPQLCHTPSFTHNFVTHNFVTHNFVTHHFSHTTLSHTTLSPTTLSHTIFHTQLCHTSLCHTPSFTHNFVTHNFVTHNLVTHHLSHTTLSHPSLSHTIFHTHNFVTHHLSPTTLPSFTHNLVTVALCVAGVALTALGWLRWHAWAPLGHRWSPVTPRHFAWQAWHLVTSTFVSRGRRGTWSHPPSFCVAGVALMALGWLRWCTWAPLGRRWSLVVAGDAAALCVAP